MKKFIELQNPFGAKKVGCNEHIHLDCFDKPFKSRRNGDTEPVELTPGTLFGAETELFGKIVSMKIVESGECETCERIKHRAELPGKVRAALLSPETHHTRFKYNAIHFYKRDKTSPSGVLRSVSCPEKLYNEIVAELKAAGKFSSSLSPLSPTEKI